MEEAGISGGYSLSLETDGIFVSVRFSCIYPAVIFCVKDQAPATDRGHASSVMCVRRKHFNRRA